MTHHTPEIMAEAERLAEDIFRTYVKAGPFNATPWADMRDKIANALAARDAAKDAEREETNRKRMTAIKNACDNLKDAKREISPNYTKQAVNRALALLGPFLPCGIVGSSAPSNTSPEASSHER